MDLGLEGAAVVVSGGSKGMGRASAEAFARDGARVAVLARGTDAIDDTIAELERLGAGDALALQADLTSGDDVRRAFAAVAERWGELNVLVNAAGPVDVGVGPFEAVDDEEWLATF
ncbi:MAG TPA: SDR family NAD(P)-dependent oxidoreductase, partial [Microthrixaceae bacterium]|nr:SDR family NAD(P)-dependent oxidoreductase [Microthrixaceae bacterium]